MNLDVVRRIHDAAIELGAQCGSECPFFPPDRESKAWMVERSKALSRLLN